MVPKGGLQLFLMLLLLAALSPMAHAGYYLYPYNASDVGNVTGKIISGDVTDTYTVDNTDLVINESAAPVSGKNIMYYLYSRFVGSVENWTAVAQQDIPADGTSSIAPTFVYNSLFSNTADGSGSGNMTIKHQSKNDQNKIISAYSQWSVVLFGVNENNNSNVSFAMRFAGKSGLNDNTQDFAACVELNGSFCGTDSRRLYLCQKVIGSMANLGGTSEYKMVEVQTNTGESTAWISNISKSILEYAQMTDAWGASCTTFRVNRARIVLRSNLGVKSGNNDVLRGFDFDEIYITNESDLPAQWAVEVWHNSTATNMVLDGDVYGINATMRIKSAVAMDVTMKIYNWSHGGVAPEWRDCQSITSLVPDTYSYINCSVCADASCVVQTATRAELGQDFRAPTGTDADRPIRIWINSSDREAALQSNLSIDYIRYTINYSHLECGDVISESVNFSHDLGEGGVGPCLRIGAGDIYINCTGSQITGAGVGVAIYNPQYDNVVVRDCRITLFEKGIYFQNGSNNAIFINDTVTSSNDGIYIDHSNTSRMWNNSFSNLNFEGVVLNVSDWSAIFNSTFNTIRLNAIHLFKANNSFVYNNSIITGTFEDKVSGVLVNQSNGSTVSNNSIVTADRGITLSYSNATRVENSTIDLSKIYGIHLSYSNNSFLFNTSVTNGTFSSANDPAEGVYLDNSWFNLFQNVSSWNNSGTGYSFSSSDNNTVQNSTLKRNGLAGSGHGIFLLVSNNNTFSNVSSEDQLADMTTSGVFISIGWGNRFLNFTARNNSQGMWFFEGDSGRIVNSTVSNNTYGIIFEGGTDNNYIVNSTVLPAGLFSALSRSFSVNNTFLNSTINIWNATAEDESYIRVQWYARIQVLDYVQAGIEGAFFNISNISALIATDLQRNEPAINLTMGGVEMGRSNWTIMEGQIITGIGLFQAGNHTFNASKDGYNTNWTNATINYSQTVVVYLPSAISDISFTVTLPGQPAVGSINTTPPEDAVYTADIEFNVSNQSIPWVNASVSPCCANQQTGATPIFLYANTGDTAINISLWLNGTTMPPGINLTASNTTPAAMGDLLGGNPGCIYQSDVDDCDSEPGDGNGAVPLSCKNITTSGARSRFVTDIQPSQSRNLFVWAFYDNFPALGGSVGTGAYTRNVTHGSEEADQT